MNPLQTAILLLISVWTLGGCASVRALRAARQPTLTPAEHLALGQTYQEQQKVDLAAQQYEAALRQDKKYVPALMALGIIAYEQANYTQARDYFERAEKFAPKDLAVINNLAMVDLAQGKPMDHATQKLEDALTAPGPMQPYLLDTLAMIALREGRFLDAKLLLNQAEALAPKNNPEFEKHLQESNQKLADATR